MKLTDRRELFRIAPGPIPLALFLRITLAVGVPLIGFTLAGHVLAGVAGGATAMLVSMCDVGTTRRGRVGTMLLGLLAIAIGGIAGGRLGGTTHVDEALVLAAAFVAAWVSNSHPGIAAAARFGALATVAGVGMQLVDPLAAAAVFIGGGCAIASAWLSWWAFGVAPDENHMDWRVGVRRALAGADVGPSYAFVYAAMAALSLLIAGQLGVSRPYWATLTLLMTMRREGMVSQRLTIQYMAGTLLGIPAAAWLSDASSAPLVVAVLATLSAACARLGLAINPALGFAAFTMFLMLVIDLALHRAGLPAQLLSSRLYDVGVGCMLALLGTRIASALQRHAKP